MEHLYFTKVDKPPQDRRKKKGFVPRGDRKSNIQHGEELLSQVKNQVTENNDDIRRFRFEPHLVMKVELEKDASLSEANISKLESMGLKVIDTEEKELMVLFADDYELKEFNKAINDYKQGVIARTKIENEDLFCAIKGVSRWDEEDRRGQDIDELSEVDYIDCYLWIFDSLNETQKKADEFIKNDNYRKPYGTRAEDIPRQCVFAGTSNVINFLPLDRSGNRRFLPIMCDASKAEVHILENEAESRVYIEQMWAEMMALYGDGKIRLKLPKEIEKNLIEYQRPFMQEDTWTGLIQEWLDHTSNQVVCVQQIYNEALKEIGKPRNSEAREIGQIMNGTVSGWKAYPNPRNIPGYGKQRGWMRVETKSGNSDETFVSVEATQMEIPFDIEK